jgi:radical SAM enzyme (TIGR01210 family)
MKNKKEYKLDDTWIRAQRGDKNKTDPYRPYAFNIEKERTSSGRIEDMATIFLTNKECPFTCLMCDLWKNTTNEKVPHGAIPEQISWALERLPPGKHIKLYNSGNFFDKQAIPVEDYSKIASLVQHFETVIVESHPRLINDKALYFRDILKTEMEVAIGLESVHPGVLPKLNKRMELKDFKNSVEFLSQNDIRSRAFILLRPPFLTEAEGIQWAKRSIDFAFDCGVECCVLIPTRAGNGALDQLQSEGHFMPPDIKSLEEVLDYGVGLKSGRVFADLWDIDLFSTCDKCLDSRKARLENTNLHQQLLPPVNCNCRNSP